MYCFFGPFPAIISEAVYLFKMERSTVLKNKIR